MPVSTPLGLVAGAGLDAAFGDPRRWHPVAGFGRLAGALEQAVWRPSRVAGAAYTVICVGSVVAVGRAFGGGRGSARHVGVTAVATWAVLGARSLGGEALAIDAALAQGDLEAARALLPRLCGRNPAGLDEVEIVRATVESVAENTSDAVVAPLLWGAVGGPAGLTGYRAVNTLDAMVGHRSERYERFGWAAARLDDVANFVPARVTGLLAALFAPLVGGSARTSLAVLRADGARHPSPNSGRCEAAFAGALGVRLGGVNVYADRVESRPRLGNGRCPQRRDIARAVRLQRGVTAATVVLSAAIAAALQRGTSSPRPMCAGRRRKRRYKTVLSSGKLWS
ncbi:MAG: cobalamin biosynthesis protein [Actinomycetota bacterium]